MAHYIKYQTDDGGVVLVEVEGVAPVPEAGVVKAGRIGDKVQDVVEDVQTKFGAAMGVIHQNAQTIIDKEGEEEGDGRQSCGGCHPARTQRRRARSICVWQ